MTKQEKDALKQAKLSYMGRPDITGVYFGLRKKDGVITTERVIGVMVRTKLKAGLSLPLMLPRAINGIGVDVIECEPKAQVLMSRMRPCPGGFSIGHHEVSAGTLGCWVRRGDGSEGPLVLSNNHVLANSDAGKVGDEIRQPGTYDGGTAEDRFGTLLEFVRLPFKVEGGKKKKPASAFWTLVKFLPNWVAWLVGCPFRLVVRSQVVSQPYPGLVDAALCLPTNPELADEVVFGVGSLAGIRDLELGESVQKVGRTTEHTFGTVLGVNAHVSVSYGDAGVAEFDDQIVIEGPSGDKFSAGGDSGSAIIVRPNTNGEAYLGGLLFAGDATSTIACKISHIISFLGIRIGQ